MGWGDALARSRDGPAAEISSFRFPHGAATRFDSIGGISRLRTWTRVRVTRSKTEQGPEGASCVAASPAQAAIFGSRPQLEIATLYRSTRLLNMVHMANAVKIMVLLAALPHLALNFLLCHLLWTCLFGLKVPCFFWLTTPR